VKLLSYVNVHLHSLPVDAEEPLPLADDQTFLAALDDDRFDAIFATDPVDSAPPGGGDPADYPSVTPEQIGAIDIPVAYVGAGLGSTGLVPCAPAADNHREYYDNGGSPSWLYTFADAGHNDFVDPCADGPGLLSCLSCTSGDTPAAYRDLNRALAAAFFRLQLDGDASFQPWVDSPDTVISAVDLTVERK
jgi:hypothetical protein